MEILKEMEQTLGKSVEEWTKDDLINLTGDFQNIFTDDFLTEVIKRSKDEVHDIFLCVKVSKDYREACDISEKAIEKFSNDNSSEDLIETAKNMLTSDNPWVRYVGIWSVLSPLSEYNIDIDVESCKQTISEIIQIVNSISPIFGYDILLDVIDNVSLIEQLMMEKYSTVIVEDRTVVEECLEKIDAVTDAIFNNSVESEDSDGEE